MKIPFWEQVLLIIGALVAVVGLYHCYQAHRHLKHAEKLIEELKKDTQKRREAYEKKYGEPLN